MYLLLALAIISFCLCFALTPAVRCAFEGLGLLDRPNSARKTHPRPIPRVGGVPVALSYVLTLAACLFVLPAALRPAVTANLSMVWRLAPAAALIFFVGLADDLFGLKPTHKLAVQIVAALMAYWSGVRILSFDGHTVAWWSLPVTVLWLIGCTNAFNLIDGVDGLASGVGFFAIVTTVLAALLRQNYDLALATVPLAGALLAFLRYNFNPASIFLGDSGSLLLGFLLGSYGVMWSQKCSTLLGMTAPLMALSIPLLDTGLSIARRLLRHQPIFGGDRGHIHHRLLARGLTPRRVALVMYGVSGLAAAFSLLQSVVQDGFGGLVIVLFCFSAWFGIQHLGYTEFSVARRMLFQGSFGDLVDVHLSLRTFEESFLRAGSVEGCWDALREACRAFGFQDVWFHFDGRTWEAHLPRPVGADGWTLRVPLSGSDYVQLKRGFENEVMPGIVDPFVDVIRGVVHRKLQSIAVAEAAGVPAGTAARIRSAVSA